MKKINLLLAEFDNKDILTLKLKECLYEGFVPVLFYVLSYSEYIFDVKEKGLDPKRIDGNYFTVYSEEYFPTSMVDTAKSAFNKRLISDTPSHSSNMGYEISDMLTKN